MNSKQFIISEDNVPLIESQTQRINHITDRYKIMRRQMIALCISIGTNIILAFILGLVIIDPQYNRQWIKRMPD